jgi:hypothetical protein
MVEFGERENENEDLEAVDLGIKFDEAMKRVAVSVKELIPNINTEGLTLKNYELGEITDANKSRNIVQLPTALGTSFSRRIYGKKYKPNDKESKVSEQIRDKIGEVFKDQVVVDLGSGYRPFGYLIADQSGSKGYVAVEPAFAAELVNEITRLLNPDLDKSEIFPPVIELKDKDHILKKIPTAVVREDMLDFLRRLPPESVSILCSGIDENVLPDNKFGSDYMEAVAREILRVMHPDGGYVGQRFMHIELPKSDEISEVTVGNDDEKDGAYEAVNIYRKIKKK